MRMLKTLDTEEVYYSFSEKEVIIAAFIFLLWGGLSYIIGYFKW